MSQELAVYEPQTALPAVVRPVVSARDMMEAMQEYEALKRAIIQPSDVQKIQGKDHIKKSGWLRIARAFNLTVEKVSEEFLTDEDGSWGYAVVMRAIAPNGASMIGDGMVWSTEKHGSMRTRHNVRAHAFTRATNRAISNLVGGGEVSAEEINDDEPPARKPAPVKQLPRPQIVEQAPVDPGLYPDLDDEAISMTCRALAAELGISKMDYAKAFSAQVNGGKLINPADITRKQREDWYTHLLDLKAQRDKVLADQGVEDYEAVQEGEESFADLSTLDPQDMKVS